MARSRKALSRKWSVLEKRVDDAEATATRRLGLLERAHEDAIKEGHCNLCLMEFLVDYGKWRHAADCELAAEVGE